MENNWKWNNATKQPDPNSGLKTIGIEIGGEGRTDPYKSWGIEITADMKKARLIRVNNGVHRDYRIPVFVAKLIGKLIVYLNNRKSFNI